MGMSDTGTSLARVLGDACWQDLDDLVRAATPLLRAPQASALGCCGVCRAPVGRTSYCARCELHVECARGCLADVVVPVAYAIKGDQHARRLWQYKAAGLTPGIAEAAASLLRAHLLVFLRDHRACVFRAAGMAGPTHVAVVPTARHRPGPHPLRTLLAPYLRGPWAELAAGPWQEPTRELDPDRFAAAPMPGARVLLIDDTWTTGASAQSAAMALRRAGALSVATVVLGRHIGVADAESGGLAQMPFLPGSCAVHQGRVAEASEASTSRL